MPRRLILALHDHQPVGNFGDVFRKAHDLSYRPTLDLLAEHAGVKVALHHTGPLLEWFEENEPRYLDDLRAMVARGQVELLGGAFYEPMLSILPERDARGQIEMMAKFCEERLGQRPRGMWLAERVWDPDLPRVIAPTGMRFTFLDDSHFFAAGVPAGRLPGHYVTDKAGETLAIFPIDKGLRYAIPFREVDEVFAEIAAAPDGAVLTYGDDGEKFGLWPETHAWVFEKGWLRRFLGALQQRTGEVLTVHPSEALLDPPAGRVYLPTASYEEMGEWSLPAASIVRYDALVHDLKARGDYEKYKPFVRGGIWQGFLAKYPEANLLHKKMLRVSEKVARIEGPQAAAARRELYRGECNCAYWHGMFGGLYLNYLRHALYEALLRAEALADGPEPFLRVETVDHDRDLLDEVLIESHLLNVYVKPSTGGGAFAIEYRPKAYALHDVLSRRTEGYHEKLRHLPAEGAAGDAKPASIHDVVKVKEPGLDKFLVDDGYTRSSFLDRFYDPAFALADLRGGADGDRGDFARSPWEPEAVPDGLWLARQGRAGGARLRVDKTYRFSRLRARVEVGYEIEAEDPLDLVYGCELNLTLLAGNAPDRYYDIIEGRARLDTRGESQGEVFSMVDAWAGIRVRIRADRPATFWRYPIETVSQSEDGFERTFQGSCILVRFPLKLAAGERTEFQIALEVEPHA